MKKICIMPPVHNKYPFMIYQLQTKFRYEASPRGGPTNGVGISS